ncbi:MAG: CAP domain-containing protein [Trueperaceae bacterium]
MSDPSCRTPPVLPAAGAGRLVVALALLVLAAWGRADGPEQPAADLEARFLAATNQVRLEHGREPLLADPGLAHAARDHAAENAERGVLDHGSPDPARATPSQRVALAGVALVEVGENLARMPPGSGIVEATIAGWMGSPPHRRNLLEPNFTHVGFGVGRASDGIYVAQVFGARPLTRIGATATDAVQRRTEWTLTLSGDAGISVLAFVDDRPAERAVIEPDGVTLRLTVPGDAPHRLDLGIDVGNDRYLRSDVVLLDPDGWHRQDGFVPGAAYVVEASAQRIDDRVVTFELVYDSAAGDLALFADDRHRPEAVWNEGTVRWTTRRNEVPDQLQVGVIDENGGARIVERFTVVPGEPPRLVPGRPRDDRERTP